MLQHQNVVQIQDFDCQDGLYYLVMEYVDGLTLRRMVSLCRRHGVPVPLDVIAAGLEAVEVVPGRMELVDAGQDFSVLVDSANTPESIERVLRSVRATNCRRVITLIGCEGESENRGHPRPPSRSAFAPPVRCGPF